MTPQSFAHAIIMLMIAQLLYTKDSPMQREIEHYSHELEQLQVETKLVEADSPEGISLTQNYDLLQRPMVILTQDDGSFVQAWQGELPSTADVSYYFHQ